MNTLLVLLLLVSLIAMVAGLIKPGLVIRWGEKKTRPRVLMVYGGLFIVLFIALGITGNPNSEITSSKAVTKAEESQKSEQATTAKEAASKESDIKYNQEVAKKRIIDWVGEHEFPNYPKLALNPGTADGKLFETDGKKYHMFTLTGLKRAADILVDPFTGELFFCDTGLKPQPLDKWYAQYRASHKAAEAKNNRIDEKSEWVEMPRGEMVSYVPVITGVIKNVSNKPYSTTITFTLYDGQRNQLGTADASIQDLKPGSTWKFQALSNSNTATFELKGISYHLW